MMGYISTNFSSCQALFWHFVKLFLVLMKILLLLACCTLMMEYSSTNFSSCQALCCTFFGSDENSFAAGLLYVDDGV